jgi:LacI family transcriptional regulator
VDRAFQFPVLYMKRLPFGITMTAVATKTGLTRTTIWRALHQPEQVAPHTRERIQLAISDLGSSTPPLPLATLGLIVPTLSHALFADLLDELSRHAAAYGWIPLLLQSGGSYLAEISAIQTLRACRVRGLILISPRSPESDIDALVQDGLPVVTVNKVLQTPAAARFGSVVTLNVAGAYQATQHLLDTGHRDIVFFGGRTLSHSARDRQQGYQQAMKDYGARPLIYELGNRRPTFQSGAQMAQEWLTQQRRFDALVIYNDLMALGALWALQQAGVSVPEAVSLIGFDDHAAGRVSHPTLTTVGVPPELIATTVLNLLNHQSQTEGVDAGRHEQLMPTLYHRGSVQMRSVPIEEV